VCPKTTKIVRERIVKMAEKPRFSPGEIANDSGICKAVGPRGGERDYQTTVEEGLGFPPTQQPGDRWEYLKKTKHKPR
jgi:hypothetical protein